MLDLYRQESSNSSSSPSARLTCSVMRYWSNVIDSTNPETSPRQSSNRCLSSWAWDPRPDATNSSYAYVQGVDPFCFGCISSGNCRFHCSIGRRFVPVGCYMPPSRTKRNRFSTANVCYMDKRIVITAKYMRYSPLILGNISEFCGHE